MFAGPKFRRANPICTETLRIGVHEQRGRASGFNFEGASISILVTQRHLSEDELKVEASNLKRASCMKALAMSLTSILAGGARMVNRTVKIGS